MSKFNPLLPENECLKQGGTPQYDKHGQYLGCLWVVAKSKK